MAIAKQFEFFINGRGLLTDPTLPISQANLTYVLDTFHVNGNAADLSPTPGYAAALTAAIGAAIVQAKTIPSTLAGTGPNIKKQFEFQLDGRGLLSNVALPLDVGNVSFLTDIIAINGVSYKMSTFTSPQLTALNAAILAAATTTNAIAALVASLLTVTVTTNNQVHGTPDIVTANVQDQNGNPLSGVSVAFALTGGTAAGGSVAAAATTNGSGNGTSSIAATGAGTVIGSVTVAGLAVKTFTATFS